MPEITYGWTIDEVKEALSYYWQVSQKTIANKMNGKYETTEKPKRITEGKKEGGD